MGGAGVLLRVYRLHPPSGTARAARRLRTMGRESELLELAREAGFDVAGIAPLEPPPAAGRFRRWLARGEHAGMGWLERQAERIADPRRVRPTARSMLVVGLGHHRAPVEIAGGGRVARYAAGRDYHNVLGKRLRKLLSRLIELGHTRGGRHLVDAGPLLERSHAAVAGLGFESKAANLLHRRHGPWMFLGELLLDRELEPTPDPEFAGHLGSCGTCRACIDACPTDAIREPGRVDANRCISYHTIENPGRVPSTSAASFGTWVFGCDVCSEVCPHGFYAPDRSSSFGDHPALAQASLTDWLRPPEAGEFKARFEGSPLRRAGADGLARNAATALGNQPSETGRDALEGALNHPAGHVREAAAAALARGHTAQRGVCEAIERAVAREPDGEIQSALITQAQQAAERPR